MTNSAIALKGKPASPYTRALMRGAKHVETQGEAQALSLKAVTCLSD